MPKLLHDIRPHVSGWFQPLFRQRSAHFYHLPPEMTLGDSPYRTFYQAPNRTFPILTSLCGQSRRSSYIYPLETGFYRHCQQCERALQPRTRRRRRAARTA